MKYINEFINKYPDLILKEVLVYNSYWVEWSRDTFRERQSLSVTEVLSLLEDTNFEVSKRLYWDIMKEACEYWTQIHYDLEQYVLWKQKLDIKQPIHKQFKLALLKEDIEPKIAEQEFKVIIEWLPPVTATIDLQAEIKDIMWVIDYKTSRKDRNFISVKNKIQICAYIWFSWLDIWWLLYLNQKWYTFKMLTKEEIEFYTKVWLDLLEYSKYLFRTNQTINLADKK